MAPLYQHTNRQKIITPPIQLVSSYSIYSTSSTFAMTSPAAGQFRIQCSNRTTNTFSNVSFHGIYLNSQAYSGPKTTTMVIEPPAGGPSGVVGIALYNENSGKVMLFGAKPNQGLAYFAGYNANPYPISRYTGEDTSGNGVAGNSSAQFLLKIIDSGSTFTSQYRRYSDGAMINLHNNVSWSTLLGGNPTKYGIYMMPSHNTDGSNLDITISSFTMV